MSSEAYLIDGVFLRNLLTVTILSCVVRSYRGAFHDIARVAGIRKD